MANLWWRDEEKLLAEVWCEVSQEQHTHKDHTFWNRVVDMFNNQNEGDNRNKHMLVGKWTTLNLECKRFNTIYREVFMNREVNANDRLATAKTIYEQRYGGKSFKYVHVWEVLRNQPIWLIYG